MPHKLFLSSLVNLIFQNIINLLKLGHCGLTICSYRARFCFSPDNLVSITFPQNKLRIIANSKKENLILLYFIIQLWEGGNQYVPLINSSPKHSREAQSVSEGVTAVPEDISSGRLALTVSIADLYI